MASETWDTWGPMRELARDEAERLAIANAPRCPNCGAHATFNLIESSTWGTPQFVHAYDDPYRCSAYCWHDTPDEYLAAVRH